MNKHIKILCLTFLALGLFSQNIPVLAAPWDTYDWDNPSVMDNQPTGSYLINKYTLGTISAICLPSYDIKKYYKIRKLDHGSNMQKTS